MNDRTFQTATELVQAIAAKTLRAADLLEHYIERIQRLNPNLNAIVCNDYEKAREMADNADKKVAAGEPLGALHGLPITIKDNLEVAGMPCTAGELELKEYIPARHADVVQRLIDAGAIVFGKTNLPRYGEDFQTYNSVYGQTNNPWNTALTPGGSSGGAAAAVCAGLTGFDIGNDIGGSLRHPAHFCGIYSHKPSYGIVPDRGCIPPPPFTNGDYTLRLDLLVNGPLARSAQDLELALGVIAAPSRPDSKAWRIELPAPRKKKLSEYRIGVWLDDPFCPIDTEVGDCLQNTVDTLVRAGIQVIEKRPEIDFSQAFAMFADLLNCVMGANVPYSKFEEWTKEEAELGDRSDNYKIRFIHGAILRHRTWLLRDSERQIMRQKWADFFTEYDALLCPVNPVAAFPHNQGPWHNRTITVNGKERPYSDIVGWAGLTNAVYLPATVAPVGVTTTGLPVGIQIVGPYLEDYTAIHIAASMAKIVGGYIPPKGFA